MKIYRVGGAVRDRLLGLPVKDQDFVVVGSTVEEMLAQGFTPVGKDFPVFLHPVTHEEYALARTERKSAPGYRGFQIHASPEVTLEEDLARRDLTINAMAEDQEGQLIDPFHGKQDIEKKRLRHVSPAFIEDPVRILRVARFAARLQFRVAPETMALMQEMVHQGEVDALVPERVWKEIARGLMESTPSTMFTVLEESGALDKVLPELTGHLTSNVADWLNAMGEEENLARRFAVLTFSLNRRALISLGKRLRLPQDILTVALLVNKEQPLLKQAMEGDVDVLLDMLLRCDVIRRPARFEDVLAVIRRCTAQSAREEDFLRTAAQALKEVDGGTIALQCQSVRDIPDAIRQAQRGCLIHLITKYSVRR